MRIHHPSYIALQTPDFGLRTKDLKPLTPDHQHQTFDQYVSANEMILTILDMSGNFVLVL